MPQLLFAARSISLRARKKTYARKAPNLENRNGTRCKMCSWKDEEKGEGKGKLLKDIKKDLLEEGKGRREGIIRRNMEDDYGVRAKQWQHYTSRQGSTPEEGQTGWRGNERKEWMELEVDESVIELWVRRTLCRTAGPLPVNSRSGGRGKEAGCCASAAIESEMCKSPTLSFLPPFPSHSPSRWPHGDRLSKGKGKSNNHRTLTHYG